WFFLTHPRDAYITIRSSLDDAGRQRPPLGNFDQSAGLPPYTESRAFAFWSSFKRSLFQDRGSRFLTYFLGLSVVVAILVVLERRGLPAGSVAAGLILIAMACTELAIASMADAMEVPRHHLIFYAFFDLLILVAIWLCGRRVDWMR